MTSGEPTQTLPGDFERFRAQILDDDRLREVARLAGVDTERLRSDVVTSLGEAELTLRMIADRIAPGRRFLEVGAGLGVTSAYLASIGVDITSIEPGGVGFEDNERINPLLRTALGIDHPHHRTGIESVTVDDTGGPFDVVFANNVLEHVDDPAVALVALDRVVAEDGVMIHHCPNYTIPYEPHFGLPLLPIRPAFTAVVLPDRIASSGLWRSLNFLTARSVRRIAEASGASVTFERGLLADALGRLAEPEFASRHPRLTSVAPLLIRLAPILRIIPPAWATPMVFTWRPGPRPDHPSLNDGQLRSATHGSTTSTTT